MEVPVMSSATPLPPFPARHRGFKSKAGVLPAVDAPPPPPPHHPRAVPVLIGLQLPSPCPTAPDLPYALTVATTPLMFIVDAPSDRAMPAVVPGVGATAAEL